MAIDTRKQLTRKMLGRVGVDSGELLITDPSYLSDGSNAPADLIVTFETAGRDGIFPVYAVFDGDVLVRVEIDFGRRAKAIRQAFARQPR